MTRALRGTRSRTAVRLASSFGSDFNYDFQVAYSEQQRQSGLGEYNFRTFEFSSARSSATRGHSSTGPATTGTDWATYTQESPGLTAFALDDGIAYHTYSAYARGLAGLWGMYQWLDRAP